MSDGRGADPGAGAGLFSDLPETSYHAGAPVGQAKPLGQYFTPFMIADFMAAWVAAHPQLDRVLDPGVGLGIFLRALLRRAPQAKNLSGCDIDPQVLAQARPLFAAFPQVHLRQADFLLDEWQTRYDGILCNPPYQRFQNYPNRAALIEAVQAHLGLTLSGLTNLHTLFLLKAVHQLAQGGRAAFILPSEFLNSDYGVAVKRYLLAHGSLRHVIVFSAATAVFPHALTTACILLLHHDGAPAALSFTHLDSVAALAQVVPENLAVAEAASVLPAQQIDPAHKWRRYYQRPRRSGFKHLLPLAQYAQVRRGIATGDNAYFTLSEAKRLEHGLPLLAVRPCLTKAMHARRPIFSAADFEALREQGKAVYLLDAAAAAHDPAVRAYLEAGRRGGADQRYLTRHRSPWYALEVRPPAPLLATVFNRGGLRFVRNQAGVYNLTCFHCLYLTPEALAQQELLLAYLLTPSAQALLAEHQREYGDGLAKFEPNDLSAVPVIDLEAIRPGQADDICSAYDAYCRAPEAHILQRLDDLFMQVLGA